MTIRDNKNIYEAIARVQSEVTTVTKDSTNPFHKSTYASLSAVLDVLREPMARAGLIVLTVPTGYSDGVIGIESKLVLNHTDTLTMTIALPLAKQDPQGAFGALTYARRYALVAWFNLVTEDDDGNEASAKPPARTERSTVAAPSPKPASKATTVESVLEALRLATDKDTIDLIRSSARSLAVGENTKKLSDAITEATKRIGRK